MSSASTFSSGVIASWGFLQGFLIGLKLIGYISWPWWQALLPTLIGSGLLVAIASVLAVFAVFSALAEN
jgi:hypothetical protein